MSAAPPTPDETERLAKLESYDVMDTLPEAVFDDITLIAAHICQTPIALITLIDKDRQWFKSKLGIDINETPRDIAFCAHAIHGTEILHVPDARKDVRFYDNPLVAGGPHFNFYAGAPITTPEGYNVGTLCVIDDVPRELTPEQKDALARLSRIVSRQLEFRLLAARAEQATQSKSDFLANMSHELRTPLNAIIGYCDLLIEEPDADAESRLEDLGKIRRSGTHLLNLINDILDMSKIEAGKMDVYSELVSLPQFLSELEYMVLPLLARNGNKLVMQMEFAQASLNTDYTKLKQIIINLISNSAKFTTNGTVTVRMYRDTAGGVDQFIAEITDTGVGIPRDKLEQIFDVFGQVDVSTSRNYGGSGLGLAICRKLTELLGGSLSASSVVGEGSVFTLRIPICSA